MKLIFCPDCGDVVRLVMRKRHCQCKANWGYYKKDGIHAVISKGAIPLGFANGSLVKAIALQPAMGMGVDFKAFVIPRVCDHIEVKEK